MFSVHILVSSSSDDFISRIHVCIFLIFGIVNINVFFFLFIECNLSQALVVNRK